MFFSRSILGVLLSSSFLIATLQSAVGQNVGINSTGATPDASSMLDIVASDKGVLIPRVALSSTLVAAPVVSPATSLLVYNTATAGDVTPGYYYWNGSIWVRLINNNEKDAWELDGNSGTDPGTNFIGTTDAKDFVVKTNSSEAMRVTSSGYVGIGLTNPAYHLELAGLDATGSAVAVTRYQAGGDGPSLNFRKSRGGAIGENSSVQNLDVIGSIRAYGNDGTNFVLGGYMDFLAADNPSGGNLKSRFHLNINNGTSFQRRMMVDPNGQFVVNATWGYQNGDFSVVNKTDQGSLLAFFSSFDDAATSGPQVALLFGRGTKNVRTTPLASDRLGTLGFGGFIEPGFYAVTAGFRSYAEEDFTPTTTGSSLRFYTTPIGTKGLYERMRITNKGKFGFGTANLGENLSADFHIIGDANDATFLLAPNQPSDGSNATIYLAEDDNRSYGMSIQYDGGANRIEIEGYNGATNYTNLVTIDRATGNTRFAGNVFVAGTLTKGGGTFKIDHPKHPASMYLSHSFVESPDMMNIYNGNVETNNDGEAEIELPGYFEELNKDFRYQLTTIGTFSQAIVLEEINNNRFKIKTDKPNVKVSWQVTGIRKDPWAEANRIVVEQEKEDWEKGYYLHPELYGESDSKHISNAVSNITEEENKSESAAKSAKRVNISEEINGGKVEKEVGHE